YYRTFHEDAFRNPQRDSSEWRLIADRLREGRTADELKLAIDGAHGDPFHLGENSWKTPHLQLSYVLKSASKVNELIELARRAARRVAVRTNGGDEDRLCGDSGWPRWRRACAAKGIPTAATLEEWRRLKAAGSGSVEREDFDDFVLRWKAKN